MLTLGFRYENYQEVRERDLRKHSEYQIPYGSHQKAKRQVPSTHSTRIRYRAASGTCRYESTIDFRLVSPCPIEC